MVMFVELDICYIVCPKRLKSALQRIRRSEHILQRGFCGLKVFYCSNIQMAITSVNSCLLEGEVPNAASWTLVSWQYQTGKNGAGWLTGKRARWAIRSERRRPTHTTTTSPTCSSHSPPFLAYSALGNTTLICINLPAPLFTACDTFVDAQHRSGCPGKETRYKCAHVKESDRIRCSDDPVTSPYILFHRTAVTGPNCHQVPYSIARRSSPSCANE